MNAYSEDLRKKIVQAKERGMPTAAVARTFGVGISSVKRYAKTAREGGSLRPKKSPGRPPKTGQRARWLLEANLRDRPAATLSERREYLRSVAGLRVSESTVSRLLRRMGFSRKKIAGSGGAGRVPEGCLEGLGLRGDGRGSSGVRG
jgi:transposase